MIEIAWRSFAAKFLLRTIDRTPARAVEADIELKVGHPCCRDLRVKGGPSNKLKGKNWKKLFFLSASVCCAAIFYGQACVDSSIRTTQPWECKSGALSSICVCSVPELPFAVKIGPIVNVVLFLPFPQLSQHSIRSGRVVIVLSGRFAGKKAVVVKATDDGNDAKKFGHALGKTT